MLKCARNPLGIRLVVGRLTLTQKALVRPQDPHPESPPIGGLFRSRLNDLEVHHEGQVVKITGNTAQPTVR